MGAGVTPVRCGCVQRRDDVELSVAAPPPTVPPGMGGGRGTQARFALP